MQIEILTLFPEIFGGFLSSSLIKKAREAGLVQIDTLQIRNFAEPPHYHVDDTPYGGGAGMVMKPEPLARAIRDAKQRLPQAKVILLSASGARFTQEMAHNLSSESELIFVCARYEGVDQRVVELLVDDEISIGDYVLMGGEIPAMVVIEAALRLKENVLGNPESVQKESFASFEGGAILESPHYTKPQVFEGLEVPEVLRSGNHAAIEAWKKEQSLALTKRRRPDLLR